MKKFLLWGLVLLLPLIAWQSGVGAFNYGLSNNSNQLFFVENFSKNEAGDYRQIYPIIQQKTFGKIVNISQWKNEKQARAIFLGENNEDFLSFKIKNPQSAKAEFSYFVTQNNLWKAGQKPQINFSFRYDGKDKTQKLNNLKKFSKTIVRNDIYFSKYIRYILIFIVVLSVIIILRNLFLREKNNYPEDEEFEHQEEIPVFTSRISEAEYQRHEKRVDRINSPGEPFEVLWRDEISN